MSGNDGCPPPHPDRHCFFPGPAPSPASIRLLGLDGVLVTVHASVLVLAPCGRNKTLFVFLFLSFYGRTCGIWRFPG